MKKFEYIIITRENRIDNSELNSLGAQGWELISYFYNSELIWGNGYIFKREISQ